MAVVSIPNVSEGRDLHLLDDLAHGVENGGAVLLDVHSDPVHNRSVFTIAGSGATLVEVAVDLAQRASVIDMTRQSGVHPCLGGLDVCPFVPVTDAMDEAVELARAAGERIAAEAGLPVYLYGEAAPGRRALPEIRRGGLEQLVRRAGADLSPDFGPRRIDPSRGVVCVGARGPLIAFNVTLRAAVEVAAAIAGVVREAGGGLPGVRALGFATGDATVSQVSMNLVRPEETGIDEAFAAVEEGARRLGAVVVGTEIVGLPPERFMPDPAQKTARLLEEPGRSLESTLAKLPPSG